MQQKFSKGLLKSGRKIYGKCRRLEKKRKKQPERVENGVYRCL